MMFAEERINSMVQYIQSNGRAAIEELSKKFKVSFPTVRRDLSYIENNYDIKRTHGGAISFVSEKKKFSFDEKNTRNINVKKAIANKAVCIINEGYTVYLDGGSTTFYIACKLAEFENLKIITNSIPILTISEKIKSEMFVLGGSLKKKSNTIVGPYTNEILQKWYALLWNNPR